MVTKEDLERTRKHIFATKKPIVTTIKISKDGSSIDRELCIVVREEAKSKQFKLGRIPITVKEIEKAIQDCKTEEEQHKAIEEYLEEYVSFLEIANQVTKIFKGEIKRLD